MRIERKHNTQHQYFDEAQTERKNTMYTLLILLGIAALTGCLGSESQQSQPKTEEVHVQLDLVKTPPPYSNRRQAKFVFQLRGKPESSSQVVYKLTKPSEKSSEKSTDGNWGSCNQCQAIGGKAYTRSYGDLSQDGPYTFTVALQNIKTGQIKYQKKYEWAVDTKAPTINLTPSNEAKTMGFSFDITDTYGTNSAQCRLKTPSTEFTPWVDCQNPKNYDSLSKGTHIFELRTSDQAGNAAMESHTWDVVATNTELVLEPLEITPKPLVVTTPKPLVVTTPKPLIEAIPTVVVTTPKPLIEATPTDLDLLQKPPLYSNSKQAAFVFQLRGEPGPSSQIVYKLTKPNEKSTNGNWENCNQCQLMDGKSYTRSYGDLSQDGQYTFMVALRNSKTDQIKHQKRHEWTVDTEAPTINLNPFNNESSSNETEAMSFSFDVVDTHGTDSVQCRFKTSSTEFTPWVDCQSPKKHDSLTEGTHVFELQARDPAGNTAMESHTWNIDNTKYELSLAKSEIRVLEGDSAEVEIYLSSPPTTDISFFWSTVDGSANGGSNALEKDFQKVKGKKHTIVAGSMKSTFYVDINKDHTYEFHKESFSLSFAKDPSHLNVSLPSNSIKISIQDGERFYLNEDMSYLFDEETELSDIASISLTFKDGKPKVKAQLYPVRDQENDHFNFHRINSENKVTMANNKIHIPKHNYFDNENNPYWQYNLPFNTEISLEIDFISSRNREKTMVSFTTINFPEVNENIREKSVFTNNITQLISKIIENLSKSETKVNSDFEQWVNQIKWPSLNNEQKNKMKDNKEAHGLSYAVNREVYGKSVRLLVAGSTILKSSSVYQSVVWKTFDFEDEILQLKAYHEHENGDHTYKEAPNLRNLEEYSLYNGATEMARHIVSYAPKVDIYNYNFRDRFIRTKKELLRKIDFIHDVLIKEEIDIVSLPIAGGEIFEVLSNPPEYLKNIIDNGLVLSVPLGNEMELRNVQNSCAVGNEILFLPYIYNLKNSNGGIIAVQAVRTDTNEMGIVGTKYLARTHAGDARHYTLSVMETGKEGTMEASAIFAGIMALMIEANKKYEKNYTNRELLEILIETAKDIGIVGVDDLFGHGLVNVEAAMDRLENGKPPTYKLYNSLEDTDITACQGQRL